MVGKEENGTDASSENLLIPHDEMRQTYLKYFRTYAVIDLHACTFLESYCASLVVTRIG